MVDPADPSTIISDDLSPREKARIAQASQKLFSGLKGSDVVKTEHPLRKMFVAQQKVMAAALEEERATHDHPTALGDGTENAWVGTLRRFLPLRYQVAKAFVIDAKGGKSGQFDVVVFDRQYSPLLSDSKGGKFVPAESVYAVLEVKQDLDRGNVIYAGKKVESVRNLYRTSASFAHLGGIAASERQPPHILGGLLSLETAWNPPFGEPFLRVLSELGVRQHLELGCSLDSGGYEVSYAGFAPTIQASASEIALSYFLFRLLYRLQQVGTAHALDFNAYSEGLEGLKPAVPARPKSRTKRRRK